jgi:hypothetical protein
MRGSNASGVVITFSQKILYEPLGLFKGPDNPACRIRNSNAYRRGLCAGFNGGRCGGNRLRIMGGQSLDGQFSRLIGKATLADGGLSDFHVRSLLNRTSDLSDQFIWTHVL